ncbi:MAG TPA: TIM44-like domain-containing protein [Solirubrobacteraceae bacterium]|nr:TIM44-like domain-containing protein [Solirubrobacteraceae bacterium]
MSRRTLALLCAGATALAWLAVSPVALASAGGGSAGFSGGGGGGHTSGFALYLLLDLLVHIALLGHGLGALVLIALALIWLFATRVLPRMQERWAAAAAQRPARRRPSAHERRVELAAAEAADEDPEFSPDRVRTAAARLFCDIQAAWDADDRPRLRSLVSADLMREWERRLDDFVRRGWRNRVAPLGEPRVSYVGISRHERDGDRVVVEIDARMRDYVVDAHGNHLKRTGHLSEVTRVREYWTLARTRPTAALTALSADAGAAAGSWVLASIEQRREGEHVLDEQIVATPWADTQALHDEALVEGAVADALPQGTSIAEVAPLGYDGDAHAAALDLSLADARFSPAVLEAAARRAVDAWAQAIDGDDAALDAIATPSARRELLYAGDTSGAVRLVVRGPVVNRIRIVGLDAAANPPTMTIEVDLSGRRYVENRDTTAVLAGSRTRRTGFTERWTMTLTDDQRTPWRIAAVAAPVGLS